VDACVSDQTAEEVLKAELLGCDRRSNASHQLSLVAKVIRLEAGQVLEQFKSLL
jgi:hypothetical protein